MNTVTTILIASTDCMSRAEKTVLDDTVETTIVVSTATADDKKTTALKGAE